MRMFPLLVAAILACVAAAALYKRYFEPIPKGGAPVSREVCLEAASLLLEDSNSGLVAHPADNDERDLPAPVERVAADVVWRLRGSVVDDLGSRVSSDDGVRVVVIREGYPLLILRPDRETGEFACQLEGAISCTLYAVSGYGVQSAKETVALDEDPVISLVLPRACSLHGHVTDSRGGAVSGAHVYLQADKFDQLTQANLGFGAKAYAVSGPDGRFRIDNLAPGDIQVGVCRESGSAIEWVPLTVGSGEIREVRLSLSPHGSIVCAITPHSECLARGGVVKLAWQDHGGGVTAARVQVPTTHTFEGLLPGEYQVVFEGDGKCCKPSKARCTVSSGNVVSVRLGGELGAVQVWGVVRRAGVPVGGARVHAVSFPGEVEITPVTTDDAGRFSIPLQNPGSRAFGVAQKGKGKPVWMIRGVPSLQGAWVELEVGANTITGSLMNSDGVGIAGCPVALIPDESPLELNLSLRVAFTNGRGHFEFDCVGAGVYTLRAPYVYSSRFGEYQEYGRVVNRLGLSAARQPRHLEIVLPAAGMLSGEVRARGGELQVGKTVRLKSSDGEWFGLRRAARTDARGRFEIKGVAPGRYVIHCVFGGEAIPLEEVDVVVGEERFLSLVAP